MLKSQLINFARNLSIVALFTAIFLCAATVSKAQNPVILQGEPDAATGWRWIRVPADGFEVLMPNPTEVEKEAPGTDDPMAEMKLFTSGVEYGVYFIGRINCSDIADSLKTPEDRRVKLEQMTREAMAGVRSLMPPDVSLSSPTMTTYKGYDAKLFIINVGRKKFGEIRMFVTEKWFFMLMGADSGPTGSRDIPRFFDSFKPFSGY